jgi:hypothetical protein
MLAGCILLAAASPGQSRAGTIARVSSDTPADASSAEEVAQKLLNQVRDGLLAYNSRKMLSAFDRESMTGYLVFQDQVESFFAQYESFRVSIRLEETSFEQAKGTATAEFRLEGIPRDGGPAMRREGELIFEFIRTPGGWKIRDVSPRNFFS